MSRHFSDSSEWQLKQEIFQRICHHFFTPDIDLFASRLNCQLSKFVSWTFDPQASYTDAFTISWAQFNPYIFPPFNLIGTIVQKILDDRVEKAILVVPFWPTQSWFSLLMSVLISFPARLPRHTDILRMPHTGDFHPFRNRLNLVLFAVSGNNLLVKDFQRKLLMSLLSCGDQELLDSMNLPGKNSCFGVLKGKSIPLVRLKRS